MGIANLDTLQIWPLEALKADVNVGDGENGVRLATAQLTEQRHRGTAYHGPDTLSGGLSQPTRLQVLQHAVPC